MDIESKLAPEAAIVRLSGRLDVPAALGLQERLREEIAGRTRNVVFDLGALEYMTSVGIRELVGFTKDVMRQGGRVLLCRAGADVLRVLEITGLLGLFKNFPNESDALRALAGDARTAA